VLFSVCFLCCFLLFTTRAVPKETACKGQRKCSQRRLVPLKNQNKREPLDTPHSPALPHSRHVTNMASEDWQRQEEGVRNAKGGGYFDEERGGKKDTLMSKVETNVEGTLVCVQPSAVLATVPTTTDLACPSLDEKLARETGWTPRRPHQTSSHLQGVSI
jgi:hypothetical protein